MVDVARRAGVDVRLAGGLAVRRHCIDLEFMDREYSDVDLVGLSSQREALLRGPRRPRVRREPLREPGDRRAAAPVRQEGGASRAALRRPGGARRPGGGRRRAGARPAARRPRRRLPGRHEDGPRHRHPRAAGARRVRDLAGRRAHRQGADRQDQPEGRPRHHRPVQGPARARRRRRPVDLRALHRRGVRGRLGPLHRHHDEPAASSSTGSATTASPRRRSRACTGASRPSSRPSRTRRRRGAGSWRARVGKRAAWRREVEGAEGTPVLTGPA